jgi:hypothetical protein
MSISKSNQNPEQEEFCLEQLSKKGLALLAKKEFGLELKPYQTKKQMISQITTAKHHKDVHDSIARRARVNDVSVRHLPDDDG